MDVVVVEPALSSDFAVHWPTHVAFREGIQSVIVLDVLLTEGCLGCRLSILGVIHFSVLSVLVGEFRVPSVGLVSGHPGVTDHHALKIDVWVLTQIQFVGDVRDPVARKRLTSYVQSPSLE